MAAPVRKFPGPAGALPPIVFYIWCRFTHSFLLYFQAEIDPDVLAGKQQPSIWPTAKVRARHIPLPLPFLKRGFTEATHADGLSRA